MLEKQHQSIICLVASPAFILGYDLKANIICVSYNNEPAETLADVQRKKVNDWYCNMLYSCLNDKCIGKILLIMQHLYLDDLCGYILNRIPA